MPPATIPKRRRNTKTSTATPLKMAPSTANNLLRWACISPAIPSPSPSKYRNRQTKMPIPANANPMAAGESCNLCCTSWALAPCGSMPCNAWAVSVPVTVTRTTITTVASIAMMKAVTPIRECPALEVLSGVFSAISSLRLARRTAGVDAAL